MFIDWFIGHLVDLASLGVDWVGLGWVGLSWCVLDELRSFSFS